MSGAKLTSEFIERVSAESDILSVVSGYVSLKRRGNRYWGCCPFHHEKTASFSVKPDEGFFYCFGCHVGGNIFKFISMVENVNYYDAVRRQAERLNIPVPQREQTPQEIARESHLKTLRKLHELAGTFFHNCLTMTGYGKPGLEYLHGRGISDEIIEAFQLGFAPNAWDKLSTAFEKREIGVDLLKECGLAKSRQGDNGVYDTFRNRVMIPISDQRGRIVGFGGRVIGDDEPKYLNSPETAIFNKRKLLFGLDKAYRAIQQEGFALVVEGYMDVISVYSAGVRNVVASLGTAFTVEQCRSIMRYGADLYFCYDSDAAGQKATIRGLTIAKEAGANVKVVSIPDGKDPDEFIRKHGVEEFRNVILAAKPLMDFYLDYVTARLDMNLVEDRLKAKNELKPIFDSMRDNAEKQAYIVKTAHALWISEEELRSQLNQRGSYRNTNTNNTLLTNSGEFGSLESNNIPRRKAVRKIDNAIIRGERILIRGICGNPSLLELMERYIPLEYLSPEGQEIIGTLKIKLSAEEYSGGETLISELGDAAGEELSRALVEDIGDDDILVLFNNSVKYLAKAYRAQYYDELRQQSVLPENVDKFSYYLKEMQKVTIEMEELKREIK